SASVTTVGRAALGAVAPVLALSGSRSPITARQIDTAERAGWRVFADLSGPAGLVEQVEESLRDGRHTIVESTRGPARDPDGIGTSLGRLAAAMVRAGLVRRLVVAGGDTSGEVVAALGARSLDVVASPAAGAPVCVLASDDPAVDGLQVALKGGQVGGDDYFLRAAAGHRERPNDCR
ncbi:nucleotide-binding domain containing protein, partial [Nonomuraea sp. K271]